MIDNEKLSKAWYAFLGYSDISLRGGFDYFESDDVYNKVFRSKPSEEYWKEFSENPYFNPSDDLFSPGIPSVYQYLLALAVSEFVKSKRISWQENRKNAMSRGIETGALETDSVTGAITSSQREIDDFLSTDLDYRLNVIVNNISDILIELFSYIFAIKYGEIIPLQSKKILEDEFISLYLESGFLYKVLQDNTEKNNIFDPTYSFLMYCVKQFFFENRAEILATPRLKAYFFSRKRVHKLREIITRYNEDIKEMDQPWKREGFTFFESLPDIR